MKTVIYGAQSIALGTYLALTTLFQDIDVLFFLVNEKGINPDFLSGKPVKVMSDSSAIELCRNVKILICTPENVMDEIEEKLDEMGIYDHVRMTSSRFAELLSYAYTKSGEFRPLSHYPVGMKKADINMYMAKFHKDKVLKGDVEIPDFITPIQVGTMITDTRVAECVDSDGDNISARNGNYSELTALYWIWKNVLENECCNDYVGLVHYRRLLDLSDDDLMRLDSNDIDVVLPFPMPYEPNIESHHKRYLRDNDWKALIKAIEEIHPEDFGGMKDVLNQRYMCNYNILLAKKDVMKDYCAWLFPILFRVEELSEPKGNERADRYIGYMGETLLNVYFMSRKNQLRIAYTGCKFCV